MDQLFKLWTKYYSIDMLQVNPIEKFNFKKHCHTIAIAI